MSRVLFCTVPSLSLFVKKSPASLSLAMGACFLVGRLEELGFEVDHFDFNLALGKYRDFSELKSFDKSVLLNIAALKDYLVHPRLDSQIEEWANQLCAMVSQKEYSYIALSVDRRDYSTPVNKGAFHFAHILAKKLKSRFNVPVFAGGRRVYESLGPKYINSVLKGIPNNPIDKFSPHESFLTFPSFLQKLDEGLNPFSPEADEIFYKRDVFMTSRGVVPSYNYVNKEHAFSCADDIFPAELIQKHPQLADFEPLILAPYKFSVGCQFKCAFCRDGERSFFNKSEVEEVLHVLSRVRQTGIKNFLFYNNNINFNKNYVEHFSKEIINNKLGIQFSDSANLRVAQSDIFRNLADAGCVKLWFGTETVSDRLLKVINKSGSTFESTVRGLTNSADAGIWNGCNFIYNFPHETEAEFQLLVDFVKREDIFDTCVTNDFKLLVDTSYWERPQDFGIIPREVTENGMMGAYDEVGGLRWEDKVRQAGTRSIEIVAAANVNLQRTITQSDPIVFGLRALGMNKKQIRVVMYDLQEILKRSGQLNAYADYHGFALPADREIILENSIHNNEMNSELVAKAPIMAAESHP